MVKFVALRQTLPAQPHFEAGILWFFAQRCARNGAGRNAIGAVIKEIV